MAESRFITCPETIDLSLLGEKVGEILRIQHFETEVFPIGPNSLMLRIRRDRTGLKNIVGLGLESRATLTHNGGDTLSVSIENEWVNKIVALAVGWFFCLIPFITGIIGCISQGDMPAKITSAVTAAVSDLRYVAPSPYDY